MQIFCFHVKLSFSGDQAWKELEDAGVQLLYSEEEEGKTSVYGAGRIEMLSSYRALCPSIAYLHPVELPAMDWNSQWEMHAKNYREGFLRLSFGDKEVLLEPGPGFGDLSHPTTELILELMPPYIANQLVIDVGCGSGILSLAALALGAKEVIGIDIEKEALKHARKNAQLNGNPSNLTLCSPAEFNPSPLECVVLMNMITTEQGAAWPSLRSLQLSPWLLITSGIIEEEKDIYHQTIKSWGFKVKKETLKEGWWGFLLIPL